uniref:Uncharacterized protein n=1 Tax=Glossina pallidipes TaxID=7398 RepID=A0A1A9ZTU7_GLOPL
MAPMLTIHYKTVMFNGTIVWENFSANKAEEENVQSNRVTNKWKLFVFTLSSTTLANTTSGAADHEHYAPSAFHFEAGTKQVQGFAPHLKTPEIQKKIKKKL